MFSLSGFPESGWGLRSESCWVKLKILQKDLQRRWEPSSRRSGKDCPDLSDRMWPPEGQSSATLDFWCFHLPLELFGPKSLKQICNLMSWILIGDDLNLTDWSSQNCQPLCNVPRRMLELVSAACDNFSPNSFTATSATDWPGEPTGESFQVLFSLCFVHVMASITLCDWMHH